jgi:esterase/lipase superfamily enzyme
MSFLISRRAYDASKKTFTNERASVTRFLEATTSGGKTLKHDAWLSRVKSNAGGGDVLIFVHGFNTSQKELLTRTTKIEKGVKAAGFKGAVVA